MKQIIILFLLSIIVNCQSQHTKTVTDKKEYFQGSWKLIGKNYMEEGVKVSYPLRQCAREYTLVFEKQNSLLYLTKKYNSGNNCEVKNTSAKIPVTVNEGVFSYIDLDLKVDEHYEILSDSRFSIIYNDIIKGKVTEIEDVYERQSRK